MLRKILYLCFVVLLFGKSLHAQEDDRTLLEDTLIYFEELVFNSSKEESVFQEVYTDKSNDYFSLIYLSRKGADEKKLEEAKKKVEKQVEWFKSKNIKSKGEKKAIKIIYKEVHEEFFIKYELNNYFDDVFNRGYFNCLSATFIYSLMMDELQIPYQINISPNHVNLTAYPKTHNILIETTDPIEGYVKYDKKFKEDYINNLLRYKVIEEDEVMMNSVDVLFDKYYTSNKVVTLKQLVGAQYSNDGIYLMQEKNYEESIQQFEKSIALYPNTTTAQTLMSLYLRELSSSDYTNEKHIDYLTKVLRYKELKEDIEEGVVGEFVKMAEHNLLENGDTNFFNSLYDKIHPLFKDEQATVRLNYIYNGALGEYYFNELKYKEASNYFLKALHLVGDTNNLESLYMRSVVLQISDNDNMTEALVMLNNAQKNYADLGENKLFMTAKAEVISLLMRRSFERNRIKEGESYRIKLEIILDNVEVLKKGTSVGIAYAEAGSAYFRLGSKSKARSLFKKGLSYFPDHYELKYRLSLIY